MSYNISAQCPIIVSSCDNYEDCWQAFFTFFFRYWPDCPCEIYLLSNTKIYPDDRVKTITIGADHGWADNMKYILQQVNKPYFMYFLEDVFLLKKVDTERVVNYFKIMVEEKAAYLRLYPLPGPDSAFKGYTEIGLIAKEAPYRISLMTAIWDTKVFLDLLVPGENAWQMELDGTERSRKIEAPFLCVKQKFAPIDYFCTAIKRGRWFYDAVKLCQAAGINLDLNKRPVESYRNYAIRTLSKKPVIGPVLQQIPRAKRFISRIINK
jgi:hypothetical protein